MPVAGRVVGLHCSRVRRRGWCASHVNAYTLLTIATAAECTLHAMPWRPRPMHHEIPSTFRKRCILSLSMVLGTVGRAVLLLWNFSSSVEWCTCACEQVHTPSQPASLPASDAGNPGYQQSVLVSCKTGAAGQLVLVNICRTQYTQRSQASSGAIMVELQRAVTWSAVLLWRWHNACMRTCTTLCRWQATCSIYLPHVPGIPTKRRNWRRLCSTRPGHATP